MEEDDLICDQNELSSNSTTVKSHNNHDNVSERARSQMKIWEEHMPAHKKEEQNYFPSHC